MKISAPQLPSWAIPWLLVACVIATRQRITKTKTESFTDTKGGEFSKYESQLGSVINNGGPRYSRCEPNSSGD
jgi:hypothetical protein